MIEKHLMSNNWKAWIETFVIEDIRRALKKDVLEVGLIILCLIGVECLSGFFVGRKANRDTFVKFMKKYFPPIYANYADTIYSSLRNGLAHDYVIKEVKIDSVLTIPFKLKRNKDEPHLEPCRPEQNIPVYFNRELFARDFLAAWEKYSNDLSVDPQLRNKALARARQEGFLQVIYP